MKSFGLYCCKFIIFSQSGESGAWRCTRSERPSRAGDNGSKGKTSPKNVSYGLVVRLLRTVCCDFIVEFIVHICAVCTQWCGNVSVCLRLLWTLLKLIYPHSQLDSQVWCGCDVLKYFYICFKGNQGFPGEPGLPGERTVGNPGPKVPFHLFI